MPFPEVIDCHAHLDRKLLARDAAGLCQILGRCEAAGVAGVVFSLSCQAGEIEFPLEGIEQAAARYRVDVGVSLGMPPPLEPVDSAVIEADAALYAARVRELAAAGRIVAIGEVGLDYYWPAVGFLKAGGIRDDSEIRGKIASLGTAVLREPPVQACLKTQAAVFSSAINLAIETGLPLVVHGRDAYTDIFRILDDSGMPPARVMLHCFGGAPEMAVDAARRGHYVSVPSSLGYRPDFAAVAESTPLDRLLVETDSPYHSPLIGLWRDAGREADQEGLSAGLNRAAREQHLVERRRYLFRQALVESYPHLTFRAEDEEDSGTLTAAEYFDRSSRIRQNESTFVRAAALALATLQRTDPVRVCEATTRNARNLFDRL